MKLNYVIIGHQMCGLMFLSVIWFAEASALAQSLEAVPLSQTLVRPICVTQFEPKLLPNSQDDLPRSLSMPSEVVPSQSSLETLETQSETIEPDLSIFSESASETSDELTELAPIDSLGTIFPPSEQATPSPTDAALPNRVSVQTIEVIGSTVFVPEDFRSITQLYEGRDLTLEEIGQLSDAITQFYLDANYITSRAVPVDQQTVNTDGVLKIRIIEGKLTRIIVQTQDSQRLNPSYICSRIHLGAGAPLNTIKLEEQLRLLRANPLFSTIEASIIAEGEGQSSLIVRVIEADPFYGSFSVDNYSPPSVGSEQVGIDLLYRNLTGLGDELGAAIYRSTTSGAEVFDFSYQIPVNALNGTVQIRAAPNRNEITQPPFDQLGIRGNQELYEITYRQPILRSTIEELALSLGFTYQDGQTFVFDRLPQPFGIGPDENGVSRTSVFNFSQDYIRRDSQGAWSLRSQFNFGADLLDPTLNDAPIPDGLFFSWLGQVQRVQVLTDDHLLLFSAELQLTPDSLLASEQFVIGGGQSIRGYRQNARSGDNGFRFAVEDRITLGRNESGAPIIQLIPFLNLGSVWNHPDNPNKLPEQTFLIGAGLGLLLDPAFDIEGLSLRLDYGIPFISLDDRGDNAQDDGFYFSLRYQL